VWGGLARQCHAAAVRLEDAPYEGELVRHFVTTFAVSTGRPGMRINDTTVDLLATQPWPGNVRQLQNFVERLVVLSEGTVIQRSDLDRELGRGAGGRPVATSGPPAGGAPGRVAGSIPVEAPASLDGQRRETEKEALLRALEQSGNNRTRAARLLEVSRRTLYNKLREHGID